MLAATILDEGRLGRPSLSASSFADRFSYHLRWELWALLAPTILDECGLGERIAELYVLCVSSPR